MPSLIATELSSDAIPDSYCVAVEIDAVCMCGVQVLQ